MVPMSFQPIKPVNSSHYMCTFVSLKLVGTIGLPIKTEPDLVMQLTTFIFTFFISFFFKLVVSKFFSYHST